MKKVFAIFLTLVLAFSCIVAVHAAGTPVERQGWSVTASSVRDMYYANNILDGNSNSYWHSDYQVNNGATIPDPSPFYLVFSFPIPVSFSGFRYTPRTDNWPGIAISYEFYACEDFDGPAYLVNKDKWELNQQVKEVDFGYNVTARTVVFAITQGNGGHGSCAEFDLLSSMGLYADKKLISFSNPETDIVIENGKVISAAAKQAEEKGELPRTGWQVKASSTANMYYDANILDGRDTYWHSGYASSGGEIVAKDPAPYYLLFKFPEKMTFSGFRYTPRTDNWPGIMTKYDFYVCEEGEGEAKMISSASVPLSQEDTVVDFGYNIEAKAVILSITQGNGGYGSCAEFNLLSAKDDYAKKTAAEATIKKSILMVEGMTTYDPNAGERITEADMITDKSGWQAKASSEQLPYNEAIRAIDGAVSSFWHSHYEAVGSEIVSKETCPHEYEVTLPDTTLISGFCISPRSDASGRIQKYEFYGSDSLDGEYELFSAGEMVNNSDRKDFPFGVNVPVRRVKVVAVSSVGDYAVIAELDLLKARDMNETLESAKDMAQFNYDNQPTTLPSNMWTAKDLSANPVDSASNVVDGDNQTAWVHKDAAPHVLEVDLKTPTKVTEIVYHVSKSSSASQAGAWEDYDLEVSQDGTSYQQVLVGQEIPFDQPIFSIKLKEPVTARYFRFTIHEGHDGVVNCGELEFQSTRKEAERLKSENHYQLQIDQKKIVVVKNGVTTEKELDVAPFIDNGSTLIPLRGLLEEMGATIDWDGTHQKIDIFAEDAEVHLQICNNLVTARHPLYGLVRYTLPVVPRIKDDRTFVPIRFISEHLGHDVEWDGDTRTVTIY